MLKAPYGERQMLSPEISERMKTIFGLNQQPADVGELIGQFRRKWLTLPDDLRQILRVLFRRFMRYGTWPKIEEIAREFNGKPLTEVRQSINRAIKRGYVQADSETKRYGTCLWVGKEPTTHHVQVNDDVRVYAGCALDGLWAFSFTSGDGTFRTACPHCGESQSVEFQHGEITRWIPEDMLLFVGVKLSGQGSTAELGCPFINLFPNREHLEAWLQTVPEVAGAELLRDQAEILSQAVVLSTQLIRLEG